MLLGTLDANLLGNSFSSKEVKAKRREHGV